MSKQVAWSRTVLDLFIKEAMLSEDEIFIMESRVKGWTVSQQAMKLNKSEPTIHRMIAMLKKKYDIAQAKHPSEMPPRKASAKETYMDTH